MSDNTKLSKNPSLALNSFNKAITENEKLKLNINSNIVLEKEETLNIPNLSSQFEYIDMRGSSDSFALKIKYHIIKKINIDLINILMNSNWSYLEAISHGKLLNSIVRETGALGDSMGLIATQIANVFKLIIILALPTYLFPDFMIMNIGLCFLFFIQFFILQKIFYKLGKVTTATANQTG